METFEEDAPMTKLFNLKTKDEMEMDNIFSEFNEDPFGFPDSTPVEEENFQEDFTNKSQDNLEQSDDDNSMTRIPSKDDSENKDLNHDSLFENSNEKIGYKKCDICDLQYTTMQFKFHTSRCKKYFHNFVETSDVDSNLYQCKICQQNYRRTGLLYKHLEKSHDRIIAEILLDKQMMQDGFGENDDGAQQNNLNDGTTNNAMEEDEEESHKDDFDDRVAENKNRQFSSIQDENSIIPKLGYKRCNICNLDYSMGEQFKNHTAQCETYFHMVEVDTEMNIYKCKFCRSLYRRTGLLYKHMEKVHGNELTSLVNDGQSQITGEILHQNNVVKMEKNDDEDESMNLINAAASSSDDLENSEFKTNLKPCPICNVHYLSGKNHKQHVATCSKYFHLVVPNASGSYQCKFCKSTYRKTGLLYRHFEKHHAKILNQLVQNQLQNSIREEKAPASPPPIKNLEEQEEELRALREYIGPGSKPTKKMCKICNTQRETKKIEKHVQYCLKYFQFARKDEEKSNEYSCKFCQKSGFDPIGRLYYHIETRHSRMFDNKKEKTPFITKEMMSKSTHRTSFPLVSVNNQLTKANILSKKEEQNQIQLMKQTFECEICKRSFKNKFALNGHMQMHGTQKGIKNSFEKHDEKENPTNIRYSSIMKPKEKYTVPTGIQLIPIPMKRKQTAYNDEVEQQQPAVIDDEVLRECYFCTMCDEDDDADEAFKSYKPGEIRKHIVSDHSFSVKMQLKEKFEIRCFLKTDIEVQEFEDVSGGGENELHICTMCDKNETEAFKSVSASAVRKHAVEIHSYSLKMQKKYKSTIRCIQVPSTKPYSIKKEL